MFVFYALLGLLGCVIVFGWWGILVFIGLAIFFSFVIIKRDEKENEDDDDRKYS